MESSIESSIRSLSSLDRVAVIGTSCSGKSTLAAAMAALLRSTHVELDRLFWLPQWQQADTEVFKQRVEQAVAGERWIVDGNYSSVQPLILERATAVIWLDYGFPRIFARALRRTVKRVVTREELFNRNRESFRDSFLSKDSILLWVAKSHPVLKKKYSLLFADAGNHGVTYVRLTKPSDGVKVLNRIKMLSS
jgi:adenylate kinase family enzyme